MDKCNRIAKTLTIESINTKDDFLDFLLKSIKVIHFIFENGTSIIALKEDDEDLDITFLKLKEKISDWGSESTHTKPFYPRNFIKKILTSGTMMEYIDRKDNPDKMTPEDYGFNSVNNIKEFILSRIDKDDEKTGLKFKPNSMTLSKDGMPLDVYNAIEYNYKLSKDTRLYLKFEVNKSFGDAFFRMKFTSIHDDEVQP
jgi:hypothetical protein